MTDTNRGKTRPKTAWAALLAVALSLLAPLARAAPTVAPMRAAHPFWVTAYYACWTQEAGTLSPDKIDYGAVSHIVHFAATPGDDGAINDKAFVKVTPAQSQALLAAAHAAGRKVLLCIGGADTAPHFRASLRDVVRPVFIRNLVRLATARGYDGLDIDMEPLVDADGPALTTFLRELRAALSAANPRLLLTAAVGGLPSTFAACQGQLDQINLMTYDLSGPWEGFQTWYNASLYDGGARLLTPTRPLPSVQGMLQQYVAAGIAPSKLGIGLAFYGQVWTGATSPNQPIAGMTMQAMDYGALLDRYFRPDRLHWDAQAHAPYLSVDAPTPAGRKFISYDDERLVAEKIAYARQHGLGGVIIWELGSGYRANQSGGEKDRLLQAVKRAWHTTTRP